MQWYGNHTHTIGVYEPNYSPSSSRSNKGKLIEWNAADLQWKTPDGAKPDDQSKDCSILSSFASALDLECYEATTVVLLMAFGGIFTLLLILFIFFKRR